MPNFNLSDYVTVAERLALAHEQITLVVSEPPTMMTDVMGYIRATVALKDGRSATATASFRLDLQGKSAQATNPIEDCETSAIGRALGFLGYGSSKSVASREEVQEAERRRDTPASYTPASNGHGSPGKASEKQIKMLFAIWNKSGYEGKLQDWIAESYGCGIDDLTMPQASAAIETLQPDNQKIAATS